MSTFTLHTPKQYREGWGVLVTPLWEGDDEPERIADITVDVVRIDQQSAQLVGEVWCVKVPDTNDAWVPIDCFADLPALAVDDTHDLRSRYFATREAAEEHAASVRQRWEHPEPWESFVAL